MNRRSALKGLGGAALTLFGGATLAARAKAPFFERTGLPIGFQFGIIGNNPGRDMDAAFAQVAQIGFREVELSNLFGRKPEEMAAAAARAGVKIASLHLPLQAMGGPTALSLLSEPARIVEVMGTLGARWAIAPILMFPGGFRPATGESMEAAIGRAIAAAGEDIWKRTADVLNTRAAGLRPLGLGVAYHNHNLDFAPIGKTTGFEILRRETDPRLVHFEVDVGWVDLAGIDPVRFLDRLRGRVRLMHVRDMLRDKPHGYVISMDSPPVGTGRLDWARILPAAHRAGARHFIVEQESPADSRVEALGQSFRYLSRLQS